MTLEIHVMAWDRHKNVAGLNWSMYLYLNSTMLLTFYISIFQVILYFDLIVLLVVPLGVITFCYIMIIHTIWKRDTYGLVLAKPLVAESCHGKLTFFSIFVQIYNL